jgi:hypothetical protein
MREGSDGFLLALVMLLSLGEGAEIEFGASEQYRIGCEMNANRAADDRRKRPRDTPDRRNEKTRPPGNWTEAERLRRTAAIREEHHDSRAKTIQGGGTGA